jgi:hypothetical protein
VRQLITEEQTRDETYSAPRSLLSASALLEGGDDERAVCFTKGKHNRANRQRESCSFHAVTIILPYSLSPLYINKYNMTIQKLRPRSYRLSSAISGHLQLICPSWRNIQSRRENSRGRQGIKEDPSSNRTSPVGNSL